MKTNTHISKHDRPESRKGQVINNRTLTGKSKRHESPGSKTTLWEFVCNKCNNTGWATIGNIKSSTANMCGRCYFSGCRPGEKLFSEPLPGYGEITDSYMYSLRYSAYKRNLEFSVTSEYIWELFLKQDRKCALSGLNLCLSKTQRDNRTASLGRINMNMDFNKNNVYWLHKDIVFMKNKFNNDRFIELCKKVTEYNKGLFEEVIDPYLQTK